MGQKKRKSLTKASGLKSVLFFNKEVVLTSFSKGSKADIEKKIKGNDVIFEKEPKVFDVKVDGSFLKIDSENKIKATTEHPFPVELSKRKQKKQRAFDRSIAAGETIPAFKAPGDDHLRAKNKLEELYFGKTFKDNVKIQIAYNILDIKKIIAPYINDVICSVNNLSRTDSQNEEDIVGTLFWDEVYSEFSNKQEGTREFNKFERFNSFVNDAKPYMNYYGKVFIKEVKEENQLDENGEIKINSKTMKPFKSKKVIYRSHEEIHMIFRLLSKIRQSTFHGDSKNMELLFNELKYPSDLNTFLSSLYEMKISETNRDFVSSNMKSNFQILLTIYDLIPKSIEAKKMCELFYRFAIMDEGKNLGFSIKKLREKTLRLPDAETILSHDYDTIRGKLYTFINFIIFNYYVNAEAENQAITNMVQDLRMSLSDEDKETLYDEQSIIVWDQLKTIILNKLLPLMTGESIKKLNKGNKKEYRLKEYDFYNIMANSQASLLSKTLYFLALFLDGKEINEMLSSIINKFDNIDSLMVIDQEYNENDSLGTEILALQNHFGSSKDSNVSSDASPGDLLPEYKIFENSAKISEELRLIKNITRMDKDIIPNGKIFIDAANLLGISVDPKSISKSDELLNENQSIEDYVKEKIYGDTADTNLKNFMFNNVITSKRFQYLAKRVNSKSSNLMAKNQNIVRFVLNRIAQNTESQINRYYQNIFIEDDDISVEAKIDRLAKEISDINFEKFFNVVQKVQFKSKEAIEKEKKKALVGLYLTVIYLIYKNLININSRYTTAFHCLERDSGLHGFNVKSKNGYMKLSKKFTEMKYLKSKQIQYLTLNQSQIEDYDIIKEYRNQISHLNVISKAHRYLPAAKNISSYFALFHFINQSYLFDKYNETSNSFKDNPFIKSALNRAVTSGVYTKDLLHVLHTPFGYNTARYKNLSIEDLFDKNEEKDDKLKNK